MEESISLPELNAIIKALRNKEKERQKFELAVHKNVDLDELEAKSKFENVKQRVEDKTKGEQEAFAAVGIAVEEE
jgi:hypothetical protein